MAGVLTTSSRSTRPDVDANVSSAGAKANSLKSPDVMTFAFGDVVRSVFVKFYLVSWYL